MRSFSPSRQAGVTLIEVMIVLVIIAIAFAVLLPNFGWATNSARDAELSAALIRAGHAQERYASRYERYWSAGEPQSLLAFGLEVPSGVTVVVVAANASTYCMEASAAGDASRVFSLEAGGMIQDGSCP